MRALFAPIAVLLACAWIAAPAHSSTLRAGAATSNITPDLGAPIIGGFQPFPATHVHDELHARCLVLDDGKTKLALVVCDLLGLHRSVSVEARRLIEEATGIPPDHVLISATHTHSAASALGRDVYASEVPLSDYQRFVARRIADGVRRALNVARPAQIAFGTAEAPEHLFNRRWLMSEGTVPVNPFGKVGQGEDEPPGGEPRPGRAGRADRPDDLVHRPARARTAGPSPCSPPTRCTTWAAWATATSPPTTTAMFCEALKELQEAADHDPPFVAIMANGTSGDVNNINFRTPRPAKPPYEQMRFVAEDVAGKVNDALAKADWKDEAELQALYREPEIPLRRIDAELLAWAKEAEARSKQTPGADAVVAAYAGRVQQLAAAPKPLLAPLQVLRIGDVCIGTTACETFAEMGLEFKKRSPIAHSFMVELNHGYLGYLPTPRHFELGGYETWPGTNYLEPEASVKMMDALIEMATQLAPKSR